MTPSTSCYHCGLPLSANDNFPAFINEKERLMCCPGCQAVATAIAAGGLENFYQYRSKLSLKPDEQESNFAIYDLPEVNAEYIQIVPDSEKQHTNTKQYRIRLDISGITCAACAWLIEHHLGTRTGINEVLINVSAHRAILSWDAEKIKLSQILKAFSEIGYMAKPVGDDNATKFRQKENRQYLLKLGVAGLGMMQTGMLAIALYAGAFEGMNENMENFLRWVSFLFTTPVIFYSGQSFLRNAWHNLRNISFKHFVLSMDVSIALALLLAYFASAWACFTTQGEVYFDAATMFVFFLLIGRYLEMRIRHKNEALGEGISQEMPLVVRKMVNDEFQDTPVKSLQSGDLIRIPAGTIFPCDGIVIEGSGAVSEAMLTGEPLPVKKEINDQVSAGSINEESPLTIKVTALGQNTRLSAILNLVERAQSEKPLQKALADKLAAYFVLSVLLIAAVCAVVWWQIDSERALWIVISVLVVACPCALSLATPAALTVATGELRKLGFLVTRGHVIETLAKVDQIVFDKTGTLTEGKMDIASIIPLGNDPQEKLLGIAAALETDSKHPIAHAFNSVNSTVTASNITQHLASGITGEIAKQRYAIGSPEFILAHFNLAEIKIPALLSGQTSLMLANSEQALAFIILQDKLRADANETAQKLSQQATLHLLSGDRKETVARLAKTLNIQRYDGALSPQQKLEKIQKLQKAGHSVLMVGDGINDIPVLSGADISVAMGDATDLTRIHADSILLAGKLSALCHTLDIARQTRRIIRQNLTWAVLYNLIAVCLAVMGWVAPWAAAIGMSISSLLVVLNAMRIKHKKR